MNKKFWGGRFKKKMDADFERFSRSFSWDIQLLPYDLKINRAHIKALRKCQVLSRAEESKLLGAVQALERQRVAGKLRLDPKSEDVHSAIQAALFSQVGSVADKLHTGRSRNDLVSQSSRLYCKDHAQQLIERLRQLQRSVVTCAEKHLNILIPGMTHLQNAQVILVSHQFLAYAQMLERICQRLELAVRSADVCVLGSGALAGTTFDLDQKFLAKELGLSEVTGNSYDVSGDRDFILNLSYALFSLGLSLSRISEDFMILQTKGFAWVDVDESFCTGSSMMPQKKNADFLELARGTSGLLGGNFMGVSLLLKGLPTSYNRDLQWDKKLVFNSVDTAHELISIFIKLFNTLKVNQQRAAESLKDENLFATDLADYLVGKGVSFKTAHEQVGHIISFAEDRKVALSKIGLDLYQALAPEIEADIYRLFSADHSVKMKKTIGSTHPREVKRQIQTWKKKLK